MDEIRDFLKNRKNLTDFLIVLVLIFGLPLGVGLVRSQQIFNSRAATSPISFIGSNVVQRNGQDVIVAPSDGSNVSVGIELTSPLGPAASSASASLNTSLINRNPLANLEGRISQMNNKLIPSAYAVQQFDSGQTPTVLIPVNDAGVDMDSTDSAVGMYCYQDHSHPGTAGICYFTVHFNKTFTSPPTVTVNYTDVSGGCQGLASYSTSDVTTTSFVIHAYSCFTHGEDVYFNWIAVDNGPDPTPTSTSTVIPTPTATPTPTQTPTATPQVVTTTSYQISDNILGIDSAPKLPYDQDPVIFNYTFPDPTPGVKTIFVRFFSSDGHDSGILQQSIPLVPPDPTIDQSISCVVDLTGQGVNFVINGHNFGNDPGTVSVGNTNLTVNDWNDTSVDADMQNMPQNPKASLFVTLTRKSDGESVVSPACKIGISQISINLAPSCRSTSSQTDGIINNVDFEAMENKPGGQSIHQKVSIDPDGTIQGLQTVLNKGESYEISVKAPESLRKTVTITAAPGTTIADITLPLGDIFPLVSGDGFINSLDYAELRREWGSSTGSSSRPGDLNDDGVVNSVDYSCMRSFFDQKSDPLPSQPVSSTSASASASQSQ